MTLDFYTMRKLSAQSYDYRICNICMVDGAKSSGLGQLLKMIVSDDLKPTVYLASTALHNSALKIYCRFSDPYPEMNVDDALTSLGLKAFGK